MRNVLIIAVTVSWSTGFTALWTLTQKHDPGIISRYLFENPEVLLGALQTSLHLFMFFSLFVCLFVLQLYIHT